ncbi:MAG: tRNA preQ1(34) S-adenosylmethionine ribosyltransferase-isomerase QueA [Candidatus Izemoplasmatales bacterium]|nr:tRNA preQ1(34) S-adenosylmethionine ribosyltransferase-isomerase QueA [Candidatus Izemoplasmatales bacterium]
MMRTDDFDYILPEELIAQTPLQDRASSRLLICHRNDLEIIHESFHHLPKYFQKGDVLVLNDTKVLPSRLIGTKVLTNASIEVLLLRQIENDIWEALVKPARRIKVDDIVSFGDGSLSAKCTFSGEEGIRNFEMSYKGIFLEVLDKLGEMPLPPYIHEKLIDQNRYQTVYSKVVGSAAAPTAGLHFTKELLNEIKTLGVEVCYLTLHVGLGTFRPVSVEDVTKHTMHSEFYSLSKEVASLLNTAKSEKRRIIAVGTTSTRTLEAIFQKHQSFIAESGFTNIFIYPGYKFKAIDGLITNFHLPKSTLVMLVSAFASKEIIMNAYDEAIKQKYRFFSFGDSMFITDK